MLRSSASAMASFTLYACFSRSPQFAFESLRRISSSMTSAAMPSITLYFSSAVSGSLSEVRRYSRSSAVTDSEGSQRSALKLHL